MGEENKANVAVVVPNVEAKFVVPNTEAKAKAKAEVKIAISELKAKPKATFAKVASKATFVPNINAPAFVPSKMEKPTAKKICFIIGKQQTPKSSITCNIRWCIYLSRWHS